MKLAAESEGQNIPNWKRSALERIRKTRIFLQKNHTKLKAGELLEQAVSSLDLNSEIRRVNVCDFVECAPHLELRH